MTPGVSDMCTERERVGRKHNESGATDWPPRFVVLVVLAKPKSSFALVYFVPASPSATAARPASSRAIGTRYGEQDT
jgi:hypothetical protein